MNHERSVDAINARRAAAAERRKREQKPPKSKIIWIVVASG